MINQDKEKIRGECNNVSVDYIANKIPDIIKLFQINGVNVLPIYSLKCRKNNFQYTKFNVINNSLMSECDSLLFRFFGNNILVHVHLPGDRIHLNYDGTEIVFESIAFCLKMHL